MISKISNLFIWWNGQTIGTKIYTKLFGNFVVLTKMVIIILNQLTDQKDGLIIKGFVMPLVFHQLGIVGYIKLPIKSLH